MTNKYVEKNESFDKYIPSNKKIKKDYIRK